MFLLPPKTLNTENNIRMAGFELEFTNLSITEIAKIVQHTYGGNIVKVNRFCYVIKNTSLGDFKVKIDSNILNEEKYKGILNTGSLDIEFINNEKLEDKIAGLLEQVFKLVVPFEVVTPPVSMDQLGVFELLRNALFLNQAVGTKKSLKNAFALHINIEAWSLQVKDTLQILKSFIILYPWLVNRLQVDKARQLTAFINPFPSEFAALIMANGYRPTWQEFIDDYHHYNPDRNRPLDLYPLFSAILPEKISGLKNLGNVKPRPAYHYRLPNSMVDDENWKLSYEWNHWVMVEKLAYREELLEKLIKRYYQNLNRCIHQKKKWVQLINDYNEIKELQQAHSGHYRP